jgi:hypothetical protein
VAVVLLDKVRTGGHTVAVTTKFLLVVAVLLLPLQTSMALQQQVVLV